MKHIKCENIQGWFSYHILKLHHRNPKAYNFFKRNLQSKKNENKQFNFLYLSRFESRFTTMPSSRKVHFASNQFRSASDTRDPIPNSRNVQQNRDVRTREPDVRMFRRVRVQSGNVFLILFNFYSNKCEYTKCATDLD